MQEVITGTDGEYVYFDKYAAPNRKVEYFVKSRVVGSVDAVKSNTLRLSTPHEVNSESRAVEHKREESGQQWFF